MNQADGDRDSFLRAFRLAAVVATLGLAACLVQGDDGLRHVGLAFGAPRDWGSVYPFSQFEVFRPYDPWGGYDWCLRRLAEASAWIPLSLPVRRFLLLKALAAVFIGSLLFLCVDRSRIASAIRSEASLAVAFLLTALVLAQPVLRQAQLRPFAFGTLLLVYSIGREGFVRGLLASGATLALYPYLGWIYTAPVAVAHFLRGSRSFALGAAAATAASMAMQPAECWGLLASLVRSDAVRAQFGVPPITELTSLWDHFGDALLPALVVVAVLGPFVRRPARLEVEHLLMLLFAPVALKYVRYFVDVEVTLAFVAFGSSALEPVENAATGLAAAWSTRLGRAPAAPAAPSNGGGRGFRALLAASYAVAILLVAALAAGQYRELGRAGEALEPVPAGSLVLTDFNTQYQVLYNRPDLSVVPSSEIGFPRDDVKEAYLGFLVDGRPCTLARAISAAWFLDPTTSYLDPRDTDCLQWIADEAPLRLWRVAAPAAGTRP